jgi:hypothetical protein
MRDANVPYQRFLRTNTFFELGKARKWVGLYFL